MSSTLSINDIAIRTTLKSGDIGEIIRLNGLIYEQEYGYGLSFEAYVAQGMSEFYQSFTPERNRVWVCEHGDKMVGFLLLMNRGEAAQLRYFFLLPEYRGIGLGKKLMALYMAFYQECGFASSYLWTTDELETAAGLYLRHGFELVEEKASTAFGKLLVERKYELVNK